MDFMSDDFAAFPSGVAPDMYSGNVMDLSTKASPSPSGGDVSSEAGDGGHHLRHNNSGSYLSSLRSRSRRAGSGTPNGRDGSPDDAGTGAFSLKETFHLLDAVNKHLGELTNPKLKKYRIWVRIAEDVNKICDAKFNGGQCSSRFRNLKCRFGKVQSHLKATGELKSWPFYTRMVGMFPDEASFNWLNSVVPNDAKQDMEEGEEDGGGDQGGEPEPDDEEDEEASSVADQQRGHVATRARGGHTSGFTTNSAGELVPCFTLRESMTLLDVVRKHIGELKDPRTCKGKIWAKVAADVNRRCGCSHTGAQCSARYRNLKCRFLKRKQKGTDMTWTFGAKLASVLEAENEVKVEMAAAAGSVSDGNNNSNNSMTNGGVTNGGSERHQLSSLLSSNNSTSNGKADHHVVTPLKATHQPPSFVPTVTAADLRSRSHAPPQQQALNLHSSSHSRHVVNSGYVQQSSQQHLTQQQRRRRSRISAGPRSRLPMAATNGGNDFNKELMSSGTVNLVSGGISGTSPIAAEPSAGGTSGSDCFTASETVTLLDLVAKYLKDLNSPAESGVRRHDIWTRIAAELNDSYGTRYTSTQCSARFRNLKCRFIKTQEYNRVTGADKKVAFNDNIARLFAAESGMSVNDDSAANLMDNNSNSSEQMNSPLPLSSKLSVKSPYTSTPTPSPHHNNNNYLTSSSSPPGAHVGSNNNNNAFQLPRHPTPAANQRLAPPSPSTASSNGGRSSAVALKNGAVPLVLPSNSRSSLHNNNNSHTPIKLTRSDQMAPSPQHLTNNNHNNNKHSSSNGYYGSDRIQTAHSRSTSSASFALPQPVHRPPSHQSSPGASRNLLTSSPISSNSYGRQVYGMDLSGAGQPAPQPMNLGSASSAGGVSNHRNSSSSSAAAAAAVAGRAASPRIGREVVIEQLRVMHEDWVRVTERRHLEIMTVLRQLAGHMAAAGMSTPVIGDAVVMCHQADEQDDAIVEEEEVEGEEVDEEEEVDDDQTGLVEEPEDDNNADELTAEVDLMDASVVGAEDGENSAIVKEECNGDGEVDEVDEVDDEDLASSISSSAVELS